MNIKRKILTLNLMLINVFFTFSQTNEKISHKYSLELNNSISFSSITATPTFSYRGLDKHSIYLGLGTSIKDQWFSFSPFNGIVLTSGYKFFPIGKSHKLNFYFHYSLKHYIFLAKNAGYYPTKNNHYNENLLGYGFEVPIGNRFFFNHDIGVGILNEWNTFQSGGG